jgi:hypothetical protein
VARADALAAAKVAENKAKFEAAAVRAAEIAEQQQRETAIKIEESRLRAEKKQVHVQRMVRKHQNSLVKLQGEMEERMQIADESNMEKQALFAARCVFKLANPVKFPW